MLEALDPRPAGLIVASPCNPAGTMLAPDELAAIARWCHAERRAADLRRDLPRPDLRPVRRGDGGARFSPSAIVVNSFSKYFSMTGWRIGWLVLPEDLVRPVECLAQNLFISAPHIAQVAAEAAFDCTAGAGRQRRRATAAPATCCWPRCPAPASTGIAAADGAFYLCADVGRPTNDSADFCAPDAGRGRHRRDAGRGFRPPAAATRFLRFSYCGPEADDGRGAGAAAALAGAVASLQRIPKRSTQSSIRSAHCTTAMWVKPWG